jgi:hypothetical protein
MKSNLTSIESANRIPVAGQTEVSSAEVQLARDNRSRATNGRWGWQLYTCHPLFPPEKTIQSFAMPKKNLDVPTAGNSLNRNRKMSNSH